MLPKGNVRAGNGGAAEGGLGGRGGGGDRSAELKIGVEFLFSPRASSFRRIYEKARTIPLFTRSREIFALH